MLKEAWEFLAQPQLKMHRTQNHVACISSDWEQMRLKNAHVISTLAWLNY